MDPNIISIRRQIERLKGQKQQIEKSMEIAEVNLANNERSLKHHERALELIREAGLKTQKSISYHISEITSLALEAVFDDPYTLKVDFVERRSKTECDLYFERNENKIDPMDASGGGAVDVASFALRIASWSMAFPKSRSTIILDEPFNRLKGEEANLRVLEMIKKISKKLNIQFIIVSDERVNREELIQKADRTFLVHLNRKKISKVTIVEKDETEYSNY